MADVFRFGQIFKVDGDEQRTITGWASVIEENGQPLIDRQGDIIDEPTLIKAAHDFIENSRAGKVMHEGKRVAHVVDSIVMTKDLQKSLGINLNKVGWLITMKIDDDATWDKAKKGEYNTFSIGGVGRRVEVGA